MLNVLKFIWRYSVKVIGVSFAKYGTIAAEVQISCRTVIRAIKQLESLGLIKKIPTVRMNGKQGVNLLVIQRFQPIDEVKNNKSPLDVTVHDTPNKTENKQSSLCEIKTKPTYVRKAENSDHLKLEESTKNKKPDSIHDHQLDTSFLPESVHKEFVQAAKPFLNAVEIFKLWKRVLIAYKKMKLEHSLDHVIDKVINTFKQTVFMKKMGKIHFTFEGYFYRVMYEFLIVEKRQELRHKLFEFIVD